MSSMGLVAGTIVGGDFQIVRPLSAGGMGAVYVAKQLSTERERALKVMLGELVGNDELKKRFVQEAKVGAQIDSEHVVEVVAAGIDPAMGVPWLAMELLQGQDLAAYLAARGAQSPAATLALFEQLTHALGAAHDKQIVHRDLKPENVFLAQARRAGGEFTLKVLDFGIAKLLGQARTSATAAMGTPLWMAPEQTQPGSRITPAADVWAMGLIAFRVLTGHSFWRSATAADASAMMVLREIAFEPIAPASARAEALAGPRLPPGFDAWFERCVNRDPAARFPDARAMHRELVRVLGGSSAATMVSASPPISPVARPSPPTTGTLVGTPLSMPGSTDMVGAVSRPAVSVSPRRSSTPLIVGGGLAVVALALGVAAASGALSKSSDAARATASEAPAVESTRPAAPTSDATASRPETAPPVTASSSSTVESAPAPASPPETSSVVAVKPKAPPPPSTSAPTKVAPPPEKPSGGGLKSRPVSSLSESELRMLKAQCAQEGDRVCRDRASAELDRRSFAQPPPPRKPVKAAGGDPYD